MHFCPSLGCCLSCFDTSMQKWSFQNVRKISRRYHLQHFSTTRLNSDLLNGILRKRCAINSAFQQIWKSHFCSIARVKYCLHLAPWHLVDAIDRYVRTGSSYEVFCDVSFSDYHCYWWLVNKRMNMINIDIHTQTPTTLHRLMQYVIGVKQITRIFSFDAKPQSLVECWSIETWFKSLKANWQSRNVLKTWEWEKVHRIKKRVRS